MRKITKTLLALAVPVAMLAGANANASMITSWDYENLFGFDSWSSTAGGTSGINSLTQNNYQFFGLDPSVANPTYLNSTTLAWGTPTPSQFRVTSPTNNASTDGKVTGVASTNGAFVDDLTLIHDNNPIFGATLNSAVLQGSLLLRAQAAPNQELGPLTGTFKILFKETPNTAPCANAGAACPDIFVFDQANSSPLTKFQIGIIDDYTYFLSLDLTGAGLTTLNSASCAAVGQAAGCLGFITQENQSNAVNFQFKVSAEKNAIPEPGILALLGLGLAGIGFSQVRRRRK